MWKLLDGDRTIRELLAVDPFDGTPPTWVRIRRFVYHLQPYGADTWWTRDSRASCGSAGLADDARAARGARALSLAVAERAR